MKTRLWLLLTVLSLLLVPSAFAFPGDCWQTCNIEVPCNQATEPCVECIWQYDETQCIEWRQTTCRDVGACGQCTVLAEWTQNETGPWDYWKSYCWTTPQPDQVVDGYLRKHYKVTYQRQRCNGVIKVVEVRRVTDWNEACQDVTTKACPATMNKSNIYSGPNCPF